jgi:hypothetical protein
MNTKDYQLTTRRFIDSASKWVCLFAAMFTLCNLAASEALGQGACIEAFKNCTACGGDTFQGRNLIGISTDKAGKCVVTGPSGCKPTEPCASENLKACQKCLDGVVTGFATGLTISLDRPAANQLFTQGDDFPISGRVIRNSQGVAAVTVKLDFTSPRNSTAIGTPTTLTTDANGSFAWPAYFTADAAVGIWYLTVSAQITNSYERPSPVRRDFTVKKLELTAEQVNQNMGQIINLWKADPSIPNGIEQSFIEELWRPRGPKVNFREWRNSALYKPYTCSALTNKTLRFLNGLRFHPTDKATRLLLGGVDYGPVTDGTGNIHVAVALFRHEDRELDYDWATGYVLEPWWEQEKKAWGGTEWRLWFLGTDLMNGMGELGNFWKGEYPTSGGRGRGGYFPNPDQVEYSTSGSGKVAVLTYSPVEDLITDSQGRRVGRLPNGAFVKEIPDAQHAHAVLNDRTFLNFFVVPSGQYRVMVRGTGSGTFHLMTTSTTETMSYGEQPVAGGQEVTFTLNAANLKQPLMLADGRQMMPLPIGPEVSEAVANSGTGPSEGGSGTTGTGTREPSGGIGGTWSTPSGDTITLTQNGNRVTGTYRGILGTATLSGTFNGRTLTGTFEGGQGGITLRDSFSLRLTPEGTLEGRLGSSIFSVDVALTRRN